MQTPDQLAQARESRDLCKLLHPVKYSQLTKDQKRELIKRVRPDSKPAEIAKAFKSVGDIQICER